MPRPPRPVPIGDVVYPSIKAAAQAFNRSEANISYHIAKNSLHKLLESRPSQAGVAEEIEHNGVMFPSHAALAAALGVTRSAVTKAKARGRLHALASRTTPPEPAKAEGP